MNLRGNNNFLNRHNTIVNQTQSQASDFINNTIGGTNYSQFYGNNNLGDATSKTETRTYGSPVKARQIPPPEE